MDADDSDDIDYSEFTIESVNKLLDDIHQRSKILIEQSGSDQDIVIEYQKFLKNFFNILMNNFKFLADLVEIIVIKSNVNCVNGEIILKFYTRKLLEFLRKHHENARNMYLYIDVSLEFMENYHERIVQPILDNYLSNPLVDQEKLDMINLILIIGFCFYRHSEEMKYDDFIYGKIVERACLLEYNMRAKRNIILTLTEIYSTSDSFDTLLMQTFRSQNWFGLCLEMRQFNDLMNLFFKKIISNGHLSFSAEFFKENYLIYTNNAIQFDEDKRFYFAHVLFSILQFMYSNPHITADFDNQFFSSSVRMLFNDLVVGGEADILTVLSQNNKTSLDVLNFLCAVIDDQAKMVNIGRIMNDRLFIKLFEIFSKGIATIDVQAILKGETNLYPCVYPLYEEDLNYVDQSSERIAGLCGLILLSAINFELLLDFVLNYASNNVNLESYALLFGYLYKRAIDLGSDASYRANEFMNKIIFTTFDLLDNDSSFVYCSFVRACSINMKILINYDIFGEFKNQCLVHFQYIWGAGIEGEPLLEFKFVTLTNFVAQVYSNNELPFGDISCMLLDCVFVDKRDVALIISKIADKGIMEDPQTVINALYNIHYESISSDNVSLDSKSDGREEEIDYHSDVLECLIHVVSKYGFGDLDISKTIEKITETDPHYHIYSTVRDHTRFIYLYYKYKKSSTEFIKFVQSITDAFPGMSSEFFSVVFKLFIEGCEDDNSSLGFLVCLFNNLFVPPYDGFSDFNDNPLTSDFIVFGSIALSYSIQTYVCSEALFKMIIPNGDFNRYNKRVHMMLARYDIFNKLPFLEYFRENLLFIFDQTELNLYNREFVEDKTLFNFEVCYIFAINLASVFMMRYKCEFDITEMVREDEMPLVKAIPIVLMSPIKLNKCDALLLRDVLRVLPINEYQIHCETLNVDQIINKSENTKKDVDLFKYDEFIQSDYTEHFKFECPIYVCLEKVVIQSTNV